ncbi:hypothetical protein NLG97_g1786 [Lecanicillium saksenae]|uniref:Uncharacterized protein n=1 Tax=Lecanicillium saksenae TaxID=468837 RepID=A0ACC1R307_9HYPO|nr:hypothetical protein NLG97_g1786 [Lecanicillium saksenae]
MLADATDPLTAAGSMLRIVTSGVQLGTALQTYMELARDAEHELHDIVFDVNATASALKQLHIIIDADRDAKAAATSVFNDSGVREKASNSGNGGISGNAGESGTADAGLDPMGLERLTLMGKLAWPWLRPRILRCQKQLSWLKVSLLFTLQVASIAQSLLSGKRQSEETNLRQEMAVKLQKRRNSLLHGIAGKGAEKSSDGESQSSVSTSSSNVPSSKAGSVTQSHKTKGKACASGDQEQKRHSYLSSSSSSDGASQIVDLPDVAINSTTTKPEILGEGTGLKPAYIAKAVPKPGPALLAPVPLVTATALPTGIDAGSSGPQPAPDLFANTMKRPPETVSRQLPSYLSRWADRIFGSHGRYLEDEQSTTLEAYICENIATATWSDDFVHKVQFGHKRLLAGLRGLLKNRKEDQWISYLALSPEKRKTFDMATEIIVRGRNHEMTCAAIKEFAVRDGEPPFLLVFFSIGRKNEPIILHFEGQPYYLPFAACRSMKSLKHAIQDVCFSSSVRTSMLPFLHENRFELADDRKIVILPRFLDDFIKPGAHLHFLPHKDWQPRQFVPVARGRRSAPFAFGMGVPRMKHSGRVSPIGDSTTQSDTASRTDSTPSIRSAARSLLMDGVRVPAAALRDGLDIYRRPSHAVTVDYLSSWAKTKYKLGTFPAERINWEHMGMLYGPKYQQADGTEHCSTRRRASVVGCRCPSLYRDEDPGWLGMATGADVDPGLEVVDVDLETLKGEMSLDHWLKKLTNVSQAQAGAGSA